MTKNENKIVNKIEKKRVLVFKMQNKMEGEREEGKGVQGEGAFSLCIFSLGNSL